MTNLFPDEGSNVLLQTHIFDTERSGVVVGREVAWPQRYVAPVHRSGVDDTDNRTPCILLCGETHNVKIHRVAASLLALSLENNFGVSEASSAIVHHFRSFHDTSLPPFRIDPPHEIKYMNGDINIF
jgi:hypothetical protein